MTTTSDTATHEPATTERLIELGRDREAVASATRDLHAPDRRETGPNEGAAMDGVEQLTEIVPALRTIAARIEPAQLGLSTACKDFTVQGVLEHMIGGATAFAPAFRGEPAGDVDHHGTVQERFDRAMADLLDAVQATGAQERTIASPFGDVPGATFARYVAFDGLVHGWDLTTATGQLYAPANDLVADVDAFARGLLQPEMRDGDTFAVETEAPADATPIERLVAFSGRQLG